jgi:hypothetical protein
VHSPEFAFERKVDNVKRAAADREARAAKADERLS